MASPVDAQQYKEVSRTAGHETLENWRHVLFGKTTESVAKPSSLSLGNATTVTITGHLDVTQLKFHNSKRKRAGT